MYTVGIDLGGTNIAAGVVDGDCKIIAKASIPTKCPRPAEEIMDDMINVTQMVLDKAGIKMSDLEWIGVGAPGTINRDTGVVEYSNNIRFDNVPMREYIGNKTGCKVYMANDADAAAYGEFVAGAAKGCNNAVAVTLGTGVGGGIVIDGKLYSGSNFAGAELGHTVIEVDGRPCTCGRKGCFEAYASATALANLTREEMERNPDTVMWQIAGSLDKVGGKTAFDAMRKGDESGKKVVDLYIKYLACGITNIVNIFQPDILCISGGISKEGETLTAPLRKLVEEERYSKNSAKQTKIVTALLGNDAGIIGAAMLGKN